MTGKVALVTGSGKGIGNAIALELAGRGYVVAVNYRSSANLAAELVAQIEASGGKAVAFQADVSVPEDVTRLFSDVKEKLGPVAVLVNNAGITKDGLLMRMKDSDWDSVMDANLRSVFLCSREAIKMMVREKFGRIVNISSVVGLVGNVGQANYCATKAGVLGFTKSVAREYASKGITVNAVAPGFIGSDMTDALPEAAREAMLGNIPLGRAGTAQDVAKAVAFLASDEASYITGQTLAVDGGMTMV